MALLLSVPPSSISLRCVFLACGLSGMNPPPHPIFARRRGVPIQSTSYTKGDRHQRMRWSQPLSLGIRPNSTRGSNTVHNRTTSLPTFVLRWGNSRRGDATLRVYKNLVGKGVETREKGTRISDRWLAVVGGGVFVVCGGSCVAS